MTYSKLLDELKELSPEQLDRTVTLLVDDVDEYYDINGMFISTSDDTDVLDSGHPVLYIR